MRWSLSHPVRWSPLAILILHGAALAAQQSGKAWKFSPAFGVSARFDNNPFLLAPSRKDRLEAPPAGTPPSRYANMEKATDLLARVNAELEFSGPGLGGRTMAITPDLRYDHYMSNGERSSWQAGLVVAQNLGRGSRLRLKAEMEPSTFFKNYLSDATDADGNGSIAPGERVYAPGSSSGRLVSADYLFRLKKSRKNSPTSAFVRVGAGHAATQYDAPFSVRDRAGPFALLAFALERGRLELDAGYEFASMGATAGRAVRLLDESDFGVDFNGNGSTSDLDARAYEMVDYSRTENSLTLRGRLPVGRRMTLQADFEHRRRSFGSTQPYDVGNNGRTDARNTAGAQASFKLTRALRFLADVEVQNQRQNKPLDATGDVADYSRLRLGGGFTYTP